VQVERKENRGKGKGGKTDGIFLEKQCKKRALIAIFGFNLEKEGVFGEGFWRNCVDFMEGFGRKGD
jgi:hypothetical protein